MALRNLIDGQTIKIDNHNRGGEFEWGKGVHMHKRMNKDKYSGAEVLIYLDEDKDLEFSSIIGGAEFQNRIKLLLLFKMFAKIVCEYGSPFIVPRTFGFFFE